jgi:DNA polymerase I-like protein with 3'-5' exonuclease and polymerase domains
MGKTVLLDRADLRDATDYLLKQDAFLFDVETYGPDRGNPSKAPVSWLSIASHGIGIVLPMGHPNGEMLTKATRKKNPITKKFDLIPATFSEPPKQMNPSTVFGMLEPLFMHPTIRKSAFNATFDNVAVAKYYGNTPPAPPYDDPIVQQWLLNENMISMGLKDLTTRYYQHTYDKEHVGRQVEIHPFSKVARYAYLDAKYPWLMQERHFLPMLKDEGLTDIYALEMQVLEVLISMRMTGAMVDVDMLHTLRTELSAQVIDLEGAIYKAAGQKFNLNSAPQKQKILFGSKEEGGQGLRPLKETKGGAPSTDATTLEHYPKNPVCASMLEYQEVNKILGTYINGYLGVEGDPDKPCIIYDGRIYADLVQYGTVTGRFSCRSPNLQNIPRPGTDLGTKVRGLFVAGPGKKLVVSDYGQIELVVLAHYSRAKALVDGFNNGIDAHTLTAAKVYGVAFEDVTKAMRQTAKGINFAVVYGAGPDKVAAMANITLKEAKKFLAIHEREFPEIYRFKEAVVAAARTRRPAHLRTLMGRKRRIPALFAREGSARGKAERQAVNSLIQGSAADLIKLAMVRLHAALPEDSKLILSVHDELVVECPAEKTEEISAIMREAMLGEGIAKWLSVPMTSDLKVCDIWAEAK